MNKLDMFLHDYEHTLWFIFTHISAVLPLQIKTSSSCLLKTKVLSFLGAYAIRIYVFIRNKLI